MSKDVAQMISHCINMCVLVKLLAKLCVCV